MLDWWRIFRDAGIFDDMLDWEYVSVGNGRLMTPHHRSGGQRAHRRWKKQRSAGRQ